MHKSYKERTCPAKHAFSWMPIGPAVPIGRSSFTATFVENKKVLITGATAGIGLVTARELAKMHAHLILVGRNPQKTDQVARDLREQTGNNQIDTLIGDLSSQAEVRRVADEYRHRYDQLNVLVNNVGAVFFKRTLSADGFEMTLALNHLAPFLLTNLLLDLIIASAPSRIVNVSSMAHGGQSLDLDDLNSEKHYRSMSVYGRSKLMNIYFTHELSRRLKDSGVTVNCLHPGFVASNFGKNNGGLVGALMPLVQIGAISPEKGAETSVYLASSMELDGTTGEYFVKKHVARSSAISYDQDIARQLWDRSLSLTGLGNP